MGRWKMNKLGFLNFWLYDQEEFLLNDGHILLRGNNAAGKSITTQSFIPFILDGNRSPERLDPFGTRDRKMEFYLLGDGKREESTGYLYLEFRKPGAEEYRTIGVGMRAQRGKGIDFWGFCLRDGRRVGPDGLRLHEKVGGQNLPLSKQKLRNLIGDQDCWAESTTKYKEMVNDQIFGFRDIRQYDQLIQLLIQVRRPKLSKDFRPSLVKSILNDSLQVLTDDDLSAMVSTMEQMDQLEDTLHGYRRAIQDARVIRNEYNRYNQYILGAKGQAYLEARSRTQSLQKQLQDETDLQRDLERQLREQSERQEQSGVALKRAEAQRLAMGEDDLSAKQSRLQQVEGECARLEEQLSRGEEQLHSLEDGIARREVRLRDLTRDSEDARAAVRRSLRELSGQNELLELGQEHQQYVHDIQAERPQADCQPVQSALQQRSRQIKEVLDVLRRAEEARGVYDSACQAVDEAAGHVREAKIVLGDAQAQEREERDKLLEGFTAWREENRQMAVPQEVWQDVRRALTTYRIPADWTPLRDQMDGCFRVRQSALLEQKSRTDSALSALQAERNELERQLNQIKDRPEPEFPRGAQIQETRIHLAMAGVPCAPLYELVDFAPELPQERRDLLEAQLLDAGLLDALVVPQEHLPAVKELLAEHPDRFLVPGPAAADPIDSLLPDATGRFPEEAAACLRGISQSDLTAETALLPDGRFRCGMVRGYSRPEAPAGFIGTAARKANRLRQIQELEGQLERLAEKVETAQTELETCEGQLAQLELERAHMPTAEELDQALALLEQARRALQLAEEEEERRASAAQEAKKGWAALEQKVLEGSAGLPYERTVSAYEEAQGAAADYQSALNTLDRHRQKLDYMIRSLRDEQDNLERDYDLADSRKKENQGIQGEISVKRASVQELRDFLNRPENQARARRLAELAREIDLQNRENREAEKQCVRLKEQLNSSAAMMARRKDDLTEAMIHEQDMERYFQEDWNLGLSDLSKDLGLEERARQAASKIPASARGRTPAEMGESVSRNYQANRGSLSNYHPEIKMIFDAASRPNQLRQRYAITLKKGGKELTLDGFIQSLQNDIDTTGALLEDRDRELFENILTETISHTLRARVEASGQWVRSMTGLMATLTTSMGLKFSLDWKEKKAEGAGELDTAQLVILLNKDRALLTPEDSQKVSGHFRNKVKRARENAIEQGVGVNYADLIRSVLDYRDWYEFHLYYQRGEDSKKELTDRAFNRFSGGEKAMAMYVPLFAAVSAQYVKGGESCPMLLALDEAFAGVDDQNISAMFDLMRILDFDYIINSQVLWGCYANVPDLDIAEMHHPPNAPVVTILHYCWNGRQRMLKEDGL